MSKSIFFKVKISHVMTGVKSCLLTVAVFASGTALADPYIDGYNAYNDGNFQGAIEIWTRAANAGQHGPMTALQNLYEEGVEGWDDIADFPPDQTKAAYWRQRAETQYVIVKQMEDIYFRAVDAKNAGNFVSAAKDLKTASEGGNDHAMTLLSNMYYFGEGLTQSNDDAVYWARRADALGNMFGTAQMGIFYYEGHGVEESNSKALKYFREAESQGESMSLYYLGMMYANGYGVSTSYPTAMNYFRRAVDANVDGSQETYAKFQDHVADYNRRQAEVEAYNRGVDAYNANLKREQAAKRRRQAAEQQAARSAYQYKSWTTNYNIPATPFGSSANAQRNWARYNCNLSGGRVGC